jgi:hypothetical protein
MEDICYDIGVKALMHKLQYTIETLEEQEFAVVLKEQLPKWLREFEENTRENYLLIQKVGRRRCSDRPGVEKKSRVYFKDVCEVWEI